MKRLAALLCLLSAPAMAQSNPSFITGQIPTAAQWNSYFGKKADVTGGTINNGVLNSVTINGSLGGSPTVGGVWTASNATLSGFAFNGGALSGTFTGTGATITTTTPNSAALDNGLSILQSYTGSNLGQTAIAQWGGISIRMGSETATDQFCAIFNCPNRGKGQYQNLEVILTTPTGASGAQLAAITASVDNYSSTQGFALLAQGIARTNGTNTQSINTVLTDCAQSSQSGSPATCLSPTSGIILQNEADLFVQLTDTKARAWIADLYATQPANNQNNLQAFVCTQFSGSLYGWGECFVSGDGSTTALRVGTTVPDPVASTGNIGQTIQLLYTDNTTAVQRRCDEYVDPTLAGSIGALYRFASSYSGKCSPALDNLASFGSINAAVSAYVPMLLLDGSDRITLGSGGTETRITSTNGVVAQYLGTVASTVNNIKVVGAASGSGPSFTSAHAAGSGDASIDLTIGTFGSGVLHEKVGSTDILALASTGATVTGTLTVSGVYNAGATPGVSCSGSPSVSFASTNGIVTHC